MGRFLMTLNDRETHTTTGGDSALERSNLAKLGAASARTSGHHNNGDGTNDDEQQIRSVDARIMAVVIWQKFR